MLYTLRFFFSKCSLFHNANLFGSCIIHILYTECAEIKKRINSDTKVLMLKFLFYNKFITYLYMFPSLFAHHQEVKIVLYSIWYITPVGDRPVHRCTRVHGTVHFIHRHLSFCKYFCQMMACIDRN